MGNVEPSIIERSVEKTNIWLKQLCEELGVEDRQEAYRALRAVLHALRDRMTVDVAAKLGAQLPTLVRGIYYEEWDPSRTPLRIRDLDTFLEHVRAETRTDREPGASEAVTAVMHVLRANLSPGLLDEVLAVMPEPVEALLVA
ncbi:MAG TPA: DUF2267 domain-containing protein [Solirubrobacteraceae bacterium]|jgi:uncharacterized protein (DUF2267 family)